MADPTPYLPEDVAVQPPALFPPFKQSVTRKPASAPIPIPHTLTEITGPADWDRLAGAPVTDLTKQHKGEPLGERIVMHGRVLDENDRPVRRTMVELVQANAAGRYAHVYDQHDAPLDPNFTGVGRAITDDEGRYCFITIKPAPYPWWNGPNTWRPSHIHWSLLGPGFAARLITQMYFPGDPLFPLDAIATSVPEHERHRIVCQFDPETTEPYWAIAYRFDFVLRGRKATPMEQH